MNRQELENIIIGTLLESNDDENYFDECRCSVVPEMFSDEHNRRIFIKIAEMNAKGITTTSPSEILATYGDEVIDLVCDMTDRVNNYSFLYRKAVYNEMRRLKSFYDGSIPKYSDCTFTKYVTGFIKLVYEEDRKQSAAVRPSAAA